MPLPTFDELYVVSDMHMGGRRENGHNFQIFNQGPRLGRFIEYITARNLDGQVGLVLNGDVFDSLAEDGAGYIAFDHASAIGIVERLYTDTSFAPVWTALKGFIQTPRRHLVVIIGNHDIEVALPVVEASIRNQLASGNNDAWARMTFSSHGAGYACTVGGARVFCTHGNELDPWNWVDYSALGQLANAINAGRYVAADRWKPNAGTRLVIDVMNVIKRRLPFVDLLKPETAAVAAVLMTLDRDLVKRIDFSSALPVWQGTRQGRQVTDDMLGFSPADVQGDDVYSPGLDTVTSRLLGPHLRELVAAAGPYINEDELLLAVERTRKQPIETAESEYVETLGGGDVVAGLIGWVSKPEALRRALLDWLEGDRTYDVNDPSDALFLKMERRVADSVDFVVTGHTHQARAMTYPSGCHYYNAGTWIRSLRLTKEVLSATAFEQYLWPVLQSHSMDAIDGAKIPGASRRKVPLVFDRTTAVRIVADQGRVLGDLLRVSDSATGDIVVVPEEGTTTFEVRRS
jgi:UDP-2,3-diacylglucosamine pyrophosphatase LpxH